MTLTDQIIDEATELAKERILGNDPTDLQILDAVREITNVNFADNSIGARLAIAAFNLADRNESNIRKRLEAAWLA